MSYKYIKSQLLRIEVILLVAFMLRLLWAFVVPIQPVADSVTYHELARNILSGRGYAFDAGGLTAYWPVGTSSTYALIYKLFGLSFLPVVCFNIIVGVIIVWLTYAISLRDLGHRVAVLAAWLVAVWPILIQYTTILASELLFIFFVLAALYVWGNRRIPHIPRAMLWGALVCAATFVRPTALPLLLILPALQWLTQRDLRSVLVSLFVATISASILFSPWIYRNYQLFGGFVLVATNSGANLWMGNNPESTGAYMPLPEKDFDNEIVMNQHFKKLAVDFIKDNPLTYIKLALRRTVITYKSETIGVEWNKTTLEQRFGKSVLLPLKIVSTAYWVAMLGLGLAGIYFLLKKRGLGILHPLLVVPVFFFIIPVLTVGQDRYHVPLDPFIAIIAGYAIHCLLEKRKKTTGTLVNT